MILQQETRFIIWWCFNQYFWLVLFLANLGKDPIYRVGKMSPFSVQQMEKINLLSLMLGKNLWCEDFYLNFSGNNHLVFVFSARKFWRLTFLSWIFPNMFTYSKIAPLFPSMWRCKFEINLINPFFYMTKKVRTFKYLKNEKIF